MTDQLCFITWSHAYSLLPYPTFVKRKTYVLEPFMNQDRNGVAHLLQNGRRAGLTIESVDVRDTQCDKSPISNPHWQLENYHQSRVDHNSNSKERCVSDKNSWIIPLNTEGVIPSASPAHFIDRATFRISPVSHPNAGDLTTTLPFVSGHYRIHFEVVSAPCLKYKYFTIPCDHTKQATHVCPERYTHISALRIESMEIKDRPPGYATPDTPFRHTGSTTMMRLRRSWNIVGEPTNGEDGLMETQKMNIRRLIYAFLALAKSDLVGAWVLGSWACTASAARFSCFCVNSFLALLLC
jgi:hypothetical protein